MSAPDTRPETRADDLEAVRLALNKFFEMLRAEPGHHEWGPRGDLYVAAKQALERLYAQPTQSDAVEALRELLGKALDWAVANRGTEDAFMRCYTYPSGDMPEWVDEAERALTTEPTDD